MFYDNFSFLCSQKNVSPSAVMKAIGLNKSSASYWKKGKIPSSDTLQKLADYFGVSLDYLVGPPEEVQKAAFEKLQETSRIAQEEATSPWEKQRKFMRTVMGYTEVQHLASLSNAVEEQGRTKRTEALNAVYGKLNSSCQEKVLGYAEGLAEDEENLVQYVTLPSLFSHSTEVPLAPPPFPAEPQEDPPTPPDE